MMPWSIASPDHLSAVINRFNTLQWCHNERDGVQITVVSPVCSIVCSGADQRKYQSSASLVFVRGIHRLPVDSPHKGPVTQKMFAFNGVIMMSKDFKYLCTLSTRHNINLQIHVYISSTHSYRICKSPHHWPRPATNKVWWQCLVPTSTTRFANDVGYRIAKM